MIKIGNYKFYLQEAHYGTYDYHDYYWSHSFGYCHIFNLRLQLQQTTYHRLRV